MEDSLESKANKIPFTEIKTYEEAYYYNSDPSSRMNYKKQQVKLEKKKNFKVSKGGVELVGNIVECILEILFSFLD